MEFINFSDIRLTIETLTRYASFLVPVFFYFIHGRRLCLEIPRHREYAERPTVGHPGSFFMQILTRRLC
jgi:hypothetical protein